MFIGAPIQSNGLLQKQSSQRTCLFQEYYEMVATRLNAQCLSTDGVKGMVSKFSTSSRNFVKTVKDLA